MNLHVLPDYESLCTQTADLVIRYINQKPDSLICLASGHTPIGVFQQLHKAVAAQQVNLENCTFLSLDEWLGIDPSDTGSCLSMLQRDCFSLLNINPERIEFFNVLSPDLESECARINTLIDRNGGLDIMLVGVGTNGHIGMNEPGTSFDSVAHVSVLAEETRMVGQKYFSQATNLTQGITLGIKHLRDARLPIVMASGSTKANVLSKALNTEATEDIPVSVVHLIPNAYVMLDREAARLL